MKRFNIILDYPNRKITLRKNRFFSNSFYYNKSGISLEHDGVRVVKELDRNVGIKTFGSKNESVAKADIVVSKSYKYVLAPAFSIVELRKESPAVKAGLLIGEIILNINNRSVHEYSLQEVTQLFYDEDGKRIKLLIDRKGIQMHFQFQLESLFK